MSRPPRAKDIKRRRNADRRIEARPVPETCEESGKVMYALECDVLMAYRAVRIPTRAYLCPFCSAWHASSKPKNPPRRGATS